MVTFTKPSAVDPMEERSLETAIWYPAATGSGPINSAVGAVLDAPPATGDGAWPVVMFSHGSCGYPLQSPFLTAFLASWGFVVAAPPHPGNTIFQFPACGTPAAQAASFVERPRDVVFVLDRLLAGSGGAAFLDGTLDADRIGMMGHSFGGLTTYLATALDPRFKVAVSLAPAVFGVHPLAVPSLTMLGTIDSVVDNPATRTVYAQGVSPRYLVEIEHAGHYAFSSNCFPASDCNPPVTLTQDEAHALVLRYVLPFLQVHLVGDERFAPLLGVPSRPGLLYQSAP
jgi:predicted dienelactone hydrolase